MIYSLEITTGPSSINVSLYSSVVFYCSAVNSNFIYYLINGTLAANQTYTLKGFSLTTEETLGNKIMRNLTLASATADVNNTEIICKAGSNNIVDSDIALLRIQG